MCTLLAVLAMHPKEVYPRQVEHLDEAGARGPGWEDRLMAVMAHSYGMLCHKEHGKKMTKTSENPNRTLGKPCFKPRGFVGDRQSPAGCDWSTIRHLDLA
jgi:hypothetical protein